MDEDRFKNLANEEAADDDVEAHKKPSQDAQRKPSTESIEPADEAAGDTDDFELHMKKEN